MANEQKQISSVQNINQRIIHCIFSLICPLPIDTHIYSKVLFNQKFCPTIQNNLNYPKDRAGGNRIDKFVFLACENMTNFDWFLKKLGYLDYNEHA